MQRLRVTHALLMVVKALLRYDGEFYGLELLNDLAPTGMGAGTVYPVLQRLVRGGYLVDRYETHEEMDGAGRPPRRYYRVVDESVADVLRGLVTSRGYDKDVLPIRLSS